MEIKDIQNEREGDYGDAKEAHQAIADSWSVYLSRRFRTKIELEAKDVAILMVLFKSMREAYKHKYDNLLDLASYADFAKRFCEVGVRDTKISDSSSTKCRYCYYNTLEGSLYHCSGCNGLTKFTPNGNHSGETHDILPTKVNSEDLDDRYCKSCWEFKDVCTCGKQ